MYTFKLNFTKKIHRLFGLNWHFQLNRIETRKYVLRAVCSEWEYYLRQRNLLFALEFSISLLLFTFRSVTFTFTLIQSLVFTAQTHIFHAIFSSFFFNPRFYIFITHYYFYTYIFDVTWVFLSVSFLYVRHGKDREKKRLLNTLILNVCVNAYFFLFVLRLSAFCAFDTEKWNRKVWDEKTTT